MHASMHLRQPMHFSGERSTPPPVRGRSAPVGQASAQARSSVHPMHTTPTKLLVSPAGRAYADCALKHAVFFFIDRGAGEHAGEASQAFVHAVRAKYFCHVFPILQRVEFRSADVPISKHLSNHTQIGMRCQSLLREIVAKKPVSRDTGNMLRSIRRSVVR